MCGIAGVFGRRSPQVLDTMLKLMAHRGPDDQFVVAGEDHTLGARRLSIIDLEGGRQPIKCPRPLIWGAQNGEIYNFPDLKKELMSKDHTFHTRTDTEVIPHLYVEYGLDFPRKLEGMFAICVWDSVRKKGILVRDRSGKKPLYYFQQGRTLWFASELKALLKVPDFTRRINYEALHHYLSLKHIPAPLTIFEGIKILPPAHMLIWHDGSIKRILPYWKLDWTPITGHLHEEELADQLLELLRQGVKRRLISDVPIGFFLSGGIDSSLSTALAAELSSTPIKTFTLKYSAQASTPGKELDLKCAREIAARYGTDHLEETIDFSDFQCDLPAVLSHFDEPFSGVISTYFLSRLIAKHVKVAISGDGADELFGSYLSHRLATPLYEYHKALQEGRPPVNLGHFEDQLDFLESIYEPQDWKWRAKLSVFTESEKQLLYSPEARRLFKDFSTQRYWEDVFSRLTAQDPLNRILEAEFVTQLPDQVLAFVDRLSMAHSLEIRTAFLDTAFMEFAASIPGRFKIKGRQVKAILKRSARRYLPNSAIDRPKEGFVMPINNWLNSWLFPYAQEILAEEELTKHGLFNPTQVTTLLHRFHNGEQGLANKILSLLCFQIWYVMYMEREVPVPLGDAARLIVSESPEATLSHIKIGAVELPCAV